MSTQVVLQLQDISGILIRVISCLRKLNIETIKQSLTETDSGKQLSLELAGDSHDHDVIRSQLQALNGVKAILNISGPAIEVKAKPAPTPAVTPQPSADELETHYRMVAFSLLGRYPNISGRMIELRGNIPAENIVTEMRQIGEAFGFYLFENLKIKDPVKDLRDALQHVLRPALSPLVNLRWNGKGIEISSFQKNLNKGEMDPDYCQFILGCITGLLKAIEGFPAHVVRKTQCLHNDHEVCEYVVAVRS